MSSPSGSAWPTSIGVQKALKASRPARSSRPSSAFTPSVSRSGLRSSGISSLADDDPIERQPSEFAYWRPTSPSTLGARSASLRTDHRSPRAGIPITRTLLTAGCKVRRLQSHDAETEQPCQNQINRHQIVQKPRHDQDQDAEQNREKRAQVGGGDCHGDTS